MQNLSLLAVLTALCLFVAQAASAQDEDFMIDPGPFHMEEGPSDYYDIHSQREDYFRQSIEERSILDMRRHEFETPRLEAVSEHNMHMNSETSRIDYDAGVSRFQP